VALVQPLAQGVAVRRRTEIQLALLFVGLVVWGYGQRIDDGRLRVVGIVLFGIATALRFFKKRDPDGST
jgi:hypothetical protein